MNRQSNRGEGTLDAEQQRLLWNHVRAIEALNVQVDELREDIAARKSIAKENGFDVNILMAIIKRRKLGEGQTLAADNLIGLYEEALQNQGALPLERTREDPNAEERLTMAEASRRLHGEQALSEEEAVVVPPPAPQD